MNTLGFDILVKDQDDHPVELIEAFRGEGAVIIHIQVDKPQPALNADDTILAIGAALLGTQLARSIRAIATDMQKELDRMGYELRSKQ
jgi:hypothetical protein